MMQERNAQRMDRDGMKVAVLSDTHNLLRPQVAALLGTCDAVIHAGDIGSDEIIDRLEVVAPVVRAVAGNIDGADFRLRFGTMQEWMTEDVKVMMTHIGGYPGKYASGIKFRLETRRPKIFVAGHSHILKVIYDRQLQLLHINPGAAGVYGWQAVRTLIRLKIDGSDIKDLEVIELAKPDAVDK